MKPLWSQQAADVELEALQTDVMRFVAILGLCLAAIFSLVQGVATEQAVSPPVTRERGESPVVIVSQTPVPAAVAPPQPSTVAPKKRGFSLEFSSNESLLALLGAGQLQLYARLGNTFHVLEPGGAFPLSDPPDSYYQMRPDTVPMTLRHEIQLKMGVAPDEWGVQLNASLVAQLQEIMGRHTSGALLIDAEGRVRLDSSAETGSIQ